MSSLFNLETRVCSDCGKQWEALAIWDADIPCNECGAGRHRQMLAEINANRTFVVENIGGACPTQAGGRAANGRPFYFRARHGDWTLELGPHEAPVSILDWPDRSEAQIAGGDDPSGGFMATDDVLAILDAHLADPT